MAEREGNNHNIAPSAVRNIPFSRFRPFLVHNNNLNQQIFANSLIYMVGDTRIELVTPAV